MIKYNANRLSLFLFIVFLHSPSLYGQTSSGNPRHFVESEHISDGIVLYEDVSEAATAELQPIRLVRLDPSRAAVRIFDAQQLGAGTRGDAVFSVESVLDVQNEDIAISGGFMSSLYPPLPIGFVKSSGVVTNRRHKNESFNGVICIDEHNVVIEHIDKLEGLESWPDCLQSAPLVLKDRVKSFDNGWFPERFSLDQHLRAFAAVDSSRQLILGIIESVSLDEMYDAILSVTLDEDVVIVDALNLSGGTSAGLGFKHRQDFFGYGYTYPYVANFIIGAAD